MIFIKIILSQSSHLIVHFWSSFTTHFTDFFEIPCLENSNSQNNKKIWNQMFKLKFMPNLYSIWREE